jgi:hypothetical protein
MTASPRRPRRPFAVAIWLALLAAFLWSVALVIDAITIPVYDSEAYVGSASVAGGSGQVLHQTGSVTHSSATLVQGNGTHVLAVAAFPLLVTLLVALAIGRPRSGRVAAVVAWVCIGMLGILTFLSMLTIGVFMLPVCCALTLACALHSGRAWGITTPPL